MGKIGIIIVGIIVILAIVAYPIAYYSSAAVQEVTVQEKWIKYHGKDAKYLFSDLDGNVYSIEDSVLLFVFDASDRYARIKEGTSYTIKTYGWRIKILSWYPNAIEIKPNN